jgi:hypothetical protein
MGLSTVVWLLNPDAVQIYTNMPRDPRRAAGIDCSREGLSGAKVITFLYTTKRFQEKVNPQPHNARLVYGPLIGLSMCNYAGHKRTIQS